MRTLNAQNQKLQPLKKPKQLRDLPFSNVLKLSRDLLVFLNRLSHVRLLKNYFQFLQLFSFSSFYCSLFNSFKQQSLKNKKSLSYSIGRKGLTSVVPLGYEYTISNSYSSSTSILRNRLHRDL